MSLLSKLSIVIPTFNRPEYVMRSIRYWSDYDVTVHVLDGSQVPIKDLSLLESNINYHHLPISLMERLYKSIKLVDTEYSMMSADDEFFIPSALESCIEEMKNNHEIVSCMGSAISFLVKDKKILTNVVYPTLRNHSVNQETPLARSIYHMSTYVPSSIYSVIRSDVWKKSIHALSYKNYEVFVKSIGELQFEITSSYLGKSKIINELMWLRSFENEPIRVQESETTLGIHEFWYKDSNKLIRDEIINTIVKSISSKEEKEYMITKNVSLAFDAYIENLLKRQKKKSLKHRVVASIVPKTMVALIIRLMQSIKNTDKKPSLSIQNVISTLNKKNVNVDIEALNEIEKILLSFYNEQSASNLSS